MGRGSKERHFDQLDQLDQLGQVVRDFLGHKQQGELEHSSESTHTWARKPKPHKSPNTVDESSLSMSLVGFHYYWALPSTHLHWGFLNIDIPAILRPNNVSHDITDKPATLYARCGNP